MGEELHVFYVVVGLGHVFFLLGVSRVHAFQNAEPVELLGVELELTHRFTLGKVLRALTFASLFDQLSHFCLAMDCQLRVGGCLIRQPKISATETCQKSPTAEKPLFSLGLAKVQRFSASWLRCGASEPCQPS